MFGILMKCTYLLHMLYVHFHETLQPHPTGSSKDSMLDASGTNNFNISHRLPLWCQRLPSKSTANAYLLHLLFLRYHITLKSDQDT